MNQPPLYAVDFDQVANVGMRTKHRATFALRMLDHATDPLLKDAVFLKIHAREHHGEWHLPLHHDTARHWLRAVRFTQEPHLNFGGVEVACGKRVDLLELFKLASSSPQLKAIPHSLLPEYFDVRLGTCYGAVRPGKEAYELLAVLNERPGNGDFDIFLTRLLNLGQQHGRDLVVLEVMSERLYQRLQRVYGLVPVAGTRHLFRPLAGPGKMPAELLLDGQGGEAIEAVLRSIKLMLNQRQRGLVTPALRR